MNDTVLNTERLVLRRFTMDDAPAVQAICNDERISRYTNVLHPYTLEYATGWIGRHAEMIENKETYPFAVTLKESGTLIGAISLMKLDHKAGNAELGYWFGASHWNKGYCTEAARALFRFGFGELGLNRIHSRHAEPNGASGRVMVKAGMKVEGVLRKHAWRDEKLVDMVCYGILRDEFV